MFETVWVEEPGLTVGVVARRLGVAPATLRTWERRYGLGPSGRTSGVRRRYTPSDVALLEAMRRLTLDGVAPAEAARTVLAGGAPPTQPGRVVAAADGRLLDDDARAVRPGGPGGRVLALPEADARARGLSRAVMALDCDAAREVLTATVAELGVIDTWDRVLVPVLRAVGDRWAATGEGVEVEHLLSDCAHYVLQTVVATAPDPVTARPVLLAGAEDEGHCLPLHALAAALAERGVAARVIGAALPAEALVAAIRRTGPAAVFVWSQTPTTGAATFVEELPVTRPPAAVVVGGPGWDADDLPPRARLAYDLGDAVHLVQVAAGVV